jgi:MFS family permease
LTVATVALLLACMWGGTTYPWSSAQVLGAAAVAIVAIGALARVERRTRQPFLPVWLLRSPVPRVTAAGAVMVGILVLAITIYTPVFVQGVLGRSATTSGTVLIPLSLAWVASSFVSGQLVSRTGRYRVFPLVGAGLVVAGTLLLARAGVGASSTEIACTLLLTGAGMGMTWPVYMVAIQNAVERSQLGTASGALLFFRTMAGSVGVAVLGAVLNARLADELGHSVGGELRVTSIDHDALAASLQTVFLLLVPVALALFVVAASLKELPLRTASDKQSLTQAARLDTVAK